MACEGAEEAGKARYAVVIAGCTMRILKCALWILFLLLAPKLLRKARRSGKKAANRTRVNVPKQVKKIRRTAPRWIVPKRRRTLPL
jgi:1,4-dihydroxy-2-naphthoate octaprenyltransferase